MYNKMNKSVIVLTLIFFVLNIIFGIQWLNGRRFAIITNALCTLGALFYTFIYIKSIKRIYKTDKATAKDLIKTPLFPVCLALNVISVIFTIGLMLIRLLIFGMPTIDVIVAFGVIVVLIYIVLWENVHELIDILHYIDIDIGKYRKKK